ncbi:hypothetical protein [Rosistilla carotiformis]|uniref:hypothetical protein n=1 Tax=Rosistilla carotiformis TaxID=2528017 RepID=UPI0011A191D5|nr:hypothetical protein [Rosistilla carotiformis]
MTAILILAVGMGMYANHMRHQREVHSLRQSINDSRGILHAIEYGRANLQLIGINPDVWDDRDCSKFLKHELAVAILEHWRDQDAIDHIIGTPGYALDFASDALSFFNCKSAHDFAKICRNQLSVYPSDELRHSVAMLSDAEIASLDTFIRAATSLQSKAGG